MHHYELRLESKPSNSFRCQKAANSLDIDITKKLEHKFSVDADIDSHFNLGVIYGASGSGKTTFAKHVFGNDCFQEILDLSKPIIDQFPSEWSYDDCQSILSGVGLSQVVCWIRPAATLSNGQRFRAEIALQMARDVPFIVIDEWTSVVDRTVAKAMSRTISKFAKKTNTKIVLLSCHNDVIEWLDPDWVLDCNKQEFIKKKTNDQKNWFLRSPNATGQRGNILASIII